LTVKPHLNDLLSNILATKKVLLMVRMGLYLLLPQIFLLRWTCPFRETAEKVCQVAMIMQKVPPKEREDARPIFLN
jgi:hypothetical protein